MKLSTSLLALAVAAAAHADVAFSNLGAGDSYDPSVGWVSSGPTSPFGPGSLAFQFASATTGTVTNVSLAAEVLTGDHTVELDLFADSGSDTIDTLLGSWNVLLPGSVALV